jgi:hypothetical protein
VTRVSKVRRRRLTTKLLTDYDQEFDDALGLDRSVPLLEMPTQASYNKPDNWIDRNRIGLEKVKEQLQNWTDRVSQGNWS